MKKFTIEDFKQSQIEADRLMKEHNGHYYFIMLKTRCQFCGKSPKDKRKCGQWFQTFITRQEEYLLNL